MQREMNASEQYELNQPLNIRFHRFSNVQLPVSTRVRPPVKQQATVATDTPARTRPSWTRTGTCTSDICEAPNIATAGSRLFRTFKSSSSVACSKYYVDSDEDDGAAEPCSSPGRNRPTTLAFGGKPALDSDYQLQVERNRRLLAERNCKQTNAPLVVVTSSNNAVTASNNSSATQSQCTSNGSTGVCGRSRALPTRVSLPGSVSSSSLSYYLQAASPTPSLNDLIYLRTPSPSECESDSDREGTVNSCCSPTISVEQCSGDRCSSRRCDSLKLPRATPRKKISLTVPEVSELHPASADEQQQQETLGMAQQLVDIDSAAEAPSEQLVINVGSRNRTAHENAILKRSKHGGGGNVMPEHAHRMSLLGKPICAKQLRQARTDARWRKLQSKIYNFLERPKTIDAIAYHVFVFISVFICLLLSVLSTIESYKDFGGPALFHMEAVMLVWFTVEYILRLWSAGCRSRYQGWRGRMLFARRPFCIIDLIVIVASSAVLIISISHGELEMEFVASPLRALRFFQILRMMRMDRRGGSFKLLASVVWAHRQELFTTVYIGFLILISTAFLIYLAEKDHSSTKFQNFADALWWGVITLCTVGYGDTVPQTPIGKIIASVCAVAGISFFALPAGILGSGFALKVQQHQRQKHLIRRRGPAASLIQTCWRVYAADPCSASMATWKPHLKPIPSPTVEKSRFGRLTMRRKSFTLRHTNSNSSQQPVRADEQQPRTPKPSASGSDNGTSNVSSPDKGKLKEKEAAANMVRVKEEEPEILDSYYQLTEAHKNALRAVRKIKFLVARRKFRETLRPYDVKDVIEQYAAGHLDMLSRIKILQARLEQILGRSGSNSKDYYDSKISLAARIVNVERVVEQTESRLEALLRVTEAQKELLMAMCDKLSVSVADLPSVSRTATVFQFPPSLSPITDVSPEDSPRNVASRARLSAAARPETHLLAPGTRPKVTELAPVAPPCEDLSPSDLSSEERDSDRTEDSPRLSGLGLCARAEQRPLGRFRKARSLKYHSRHCSASDSVYARPLIDAATQTSMATDGGAGLLIRITDDGDGLDKSKFPQNS